MRRRGGKSRGNSTTPLQPPLREMRISHCEMRSVCMRRINKPGETDRRQREQSDVLSSFFSFKTAAGDLRS